MKRGTAFLTGVVALLLALTARSADVAIAVIVHPTRRVTLDRDDVARIFLKKQRFWDDGSAILPLNREAGTALRETFSLRVFGVTSAALAGYWNEQYFLGAFPPPTLSSSQAVKRYVASDPNAIGYIEASAADKSVRVVLEVGDSRPPP